MRGRFMALSPQDLFLPPRRIFPDAITPGLRAFSSQNKK